MFIRSFLKNHDTFYVAVWFLCLLVPLSFFYYSYEKFEIIKWVIWLLLMGFIGCYSARTRQFLGHISPVMRNAVIGLLGAGLVSVILAPQFMTAFLGTYPRFTNSWLFYLVWVLFLWMLVAKFSKLQLYNLLKLLMFTGGMVAILGILQSVWGFAFYEGVDRSVFARAPSFLGNPNFSSMFLVGLLPLVYCEFFEAKKFGLRIYYFLLLFFYFFGILTFSSRGAWLGLFAGVFTFLVLLGYYKVSLKFIAKYLGFVIVVVILFFSNSNLVRPETIKNTLNFTESNLNSRLLAWDMARQGIMAHPLFGVGLGNFQIYFEQHRHSALADHNGVYDDVHNLWLQQAVSGGLIFGLCFLFLCGYAFKILYEQLKNRVELRDLGLMAGMVAWMVTAAFNPVALPNFLLLAVMLGNVWVYVQLKPAVSVASAKSKVAWAYYGISILLISFAMVLLVSEISFFYGLQAFNQQRYGLAGKFFQVGKINPMSHLSESYFVATQIILKPNDNYESQIARVGKWEMRDANTFVTQAKLFYLWFTVSQNHFSYLDQAIDKMQISLALDSNYPQRYFRLGYT